LLIDNASTPRDLDNLRRIASARSNVRLIENSRNVGFAAAINQGLSACDPMPQNAHVYIVNPDASFRAGAFEHLRDLLANTTKPTLVSPLILTGHADPKIWFKGGFVDRRSGRVVHHQIGNRYAKEENPQPVVRTTFLSGAIMAGKKSTWDLLGPMREDLFLYWEDADYSMRALDSNVDMLVEPNAVAEHSEGGSSRQLGDAGKSALFYYYTSRNRLIVCGDSTLQRISVATGRGLVQTLRGIATILLRERFDRKPKLLAYVRGVYDGCIGMTSRRFEPTTRR